MLKKDYYFPEIIVYSLNFQKFTDYENSDPQKYVDYILQGIKGLESTQVDFIVMAANSPHSVYDRLVSEAKVPIYSIAEATISEAREKGLKKVLLLGIKHTMDSSFYPEAGSKFNIDVIVPSENVVRIAIFSNYRNFIIPQTSERTEQFWEYQESKNTLSGGREIQLQ